MGFFIIHRGAQGQQSQACILQALVGIQKATQTLRAGRREAENILHHTPLLFLQLTGLRAQDQVHWGKYVRFESNCPVCKHAS